MVFLERFGYTRKRQKTEEVEMTMGNGSFNRGRGNKRWGKVGAVALFTLMVSAITHSGWYAPSSAVAANPMLHNSQVLGSSKWP